MWFFTYFILCILFLFQQGLDFENPPSPLTDEQMEKFDLKYYNNDMHKSSFKLPEFARKVSVPLVTDFELINVNVFCVFINIATTYLMISDVNEVFGTTF